MKSSTRKNSLRKLKVKKKVPVEKHENVKGVIFFKKSYKPICVTIGAWIRSGKPSNVYVYDGVHQLLAHGIPIVDAIEVEGRWVRITAGEAEPFEFIPTLLHDKKRVRTSKIHMEIKQFITEVDAKPNKKLRG